MPLPIGYCSGKKKRNIWRITLRRLKAISRLVLTCEILSLLTRHDVGALPVKYRGPRDISRWKHPERAMLPVFKLQLSKEGASVADGRWLILHEA